MRSDAQISLKTRNSNIYVNLTCIYLRCKADEVLITYEIQTIKINSLSGSMCSFSCRFVSSNASKPNSWILREGSPLQPPSSSLQPWPPPMPEIWNKESLWTFGIWIYNLFLITQFFFVTFVSNLRRFVMISFCFYLFLLFIFITTSLVIALKLETWTAFCNVFNTMSAT